MTIPPAQTEESLRHWLAQEDYYPSRFTHTYLSSTPPDEANDMLALIAEDAALENPLAWGFIGVGELISLWLGAGFDTQRGQEVARRKAGIRAALHLARRGDVRAFVPLARVWHPHGTFASSLQEQIEQALIYLLSALPCHPRSSLSTWRLAELSGRVWRARRLSCDLRSGQSDLILALIRHLDGRGSEAQQALQTLQQAGKGKNRALIREIARQSVADGL